MFKPIIAAAKKLFGISDKVRKNSVRDSIDKMTAALSKGVAQREHIIPEPSVRSGSRRGGARFLRRGYGRPLVEAAGYSRAQVQKAMASRAGMAAFLEKQEARFVRNGKPSQFANYMGTKA